MRRLTSAVLAGTLAAAVAATLAQTPATAAMSGDAPSQRDSQGNSAAHRQDNRPGPLTKEQNALRAAAVEALVEGRATKQAAQGGGSTVHLGKGKNVEFFDNTKQARVLSILSEFGDTVSNKRGTPGPKHNEIPQPAESDNSTTWQPDYNQAYYDGLFNGPGESFKSFYRQISGGQYTAEGTVEDWVTVPNNGAYYGANSVEDYGGAWRFIQDTGNSWYSAKVAKLGSKAAVDDYLAQFDRWDRYDYDGDGNFNEPDGYIDHFQAIHAGEGEEAGASPDAIWSHRWYVNADDFGETGPTVDLKGNKQAQVLYGGARIGDSKYFIGDYTVEPENGGLGVFAHEYGHDLGLPDFYDTAGGENGTAFWTLMSSGSWLGHGADTDGSGPDTGDEGIGTTPGGMGPDERMFLGWLNYVTVEPGESGAFTLSPAGLQTAPSGTVQAVRINLPDKTTSTDYTTPPEGTHAWWSGRDDNLNNTLTRPVSAGSTVTVTAQAWWDIEAGYDYLYGEYSTDGGANWQSAGPALDGASGGWQAHTWSYSAGGQQSLFRFRYQTDGGVNEPGAFLDGIAVNVDGTVVATDGAEAGNNGWTPNGWSISTGTDTKQSKQYFLLENRAHVGYDETLGEGPYNFDKAYTAPNHVEFFPFQEGMLVWFADKSQSDNNTSAHPGYGQALPIDARPEPFWYSDGTKPSNRRQPFDATFGLQPIDRMCLHKEIRQRNNASIEACAEAGPAKVVFDDSDENAYWSADNPWSSSKTPGSGVTATVTGQQPGGNLTVSVNNPAQ